MKQPILLSPHIQGDVILPKSHDTPENLLNFILTTHGLSKWMQGDLWYIAPTEELIQKLEMTSRYEKKQQTTQSSLSRTWQIQYAKAAAIGERIKQDYHSLLSENSHLTIDVRTNRIVLNDNPFVIQQIHHLIQEMDIPIKQISISATLLRIDQNKEQQLGLLLEPMHQSDNTRDHQDSSSALSSTAWQLLTSWRIHDMTLPIKLSALEKSGQAEILSNPYLFTADQQSASIEAGEEVPYQEMTEKGNATVAFKKAVLGLKVTPHLLPHRQILLELDITQDQPNHLSMTGTPSIKTHQIHTNIQLKDGETIVLGGIYEENQDNSLEGIPVLHSLPVVGWVFKGQNVGHNKRELLIFVTPRIMN